MFKFIKINKNKKSERKTKCSYCEPYGLSGKNYKIHWK